MKVSIITINYNNAEGFKRTCQSVVEQDLSDCEWIVIDGNSTDGGKEILHSYSHQMAYWVSEPDNGIYHAMNKGIEQAKGEFCLFMNSGDTFHEKNVLSRVKPLLRDKDFYVGHLLRVGKHNLIIPAEDDVTCFRLLQMPYSHQSSFIRTEMLKQRPYREDFKMMSDWEQMVFELLLNERSYCKLDFIVADFDTLGISSLNKELYQKERAQILNEYFTPRILNSLIGRNDFERKILHSLGKENELGKDFKILRNVLKKTVKDLWNGLLRR